MNCLDSGYSKVIAYVVSTESSNAGLFYLHIIFSLFNLVFNGIPAIAGVHIQTT